MPTIELAAGHAWAGEVAIGARLAITAMTGASLVCFNRANPAERFDQARTKVYNMRLCVEPGDRLFSKLNNPMMRVVDDGFAGIGRHDLQLGACSTCLASLAAALEPWQIARALIPMPLNAFMHADIDTVSGAIAPTGVRPGQPVSLELVCEMDLIVALAACPDPSAPEGGKPVCLSVGV